MHLSMSCPNGGSAGIPWGYWQFSNFFSIIPTMVVCVHVNKLNAPPSKLYKLWTNMSIKVTQPLSQDVFFSIARTMGGLSRITTEYHWWNMLYQWCLLVNFHREPIKIWYKMSNYLINNFYCKPIKIYITFIKNQGLKSYL